MVVCKNCQKEVPQLERKRKREFCGSTCRSNYWQKQKRAAKSTESGKASPDKPKTTDSPKKNTRARNASNKPKTEGATISTPKTFADFRILAEKGISLDDLDLLLIREGGKLSVGEKDLVRRKRVNP